MGIEKKIIATPLGSKETFYFDTTNIKEYRRIVGGTGWPSGDNPGFICVAGEDVNKITRLKTRKCWLLAEFESSDIEKLVKRMYDLQNKYLIETWYSDTENALMMHFVDRFNRKLSKKKKDVCISEAPFIGEAHNLRVYAHQIKGRVSPAKKTLQFGGNSRIPGVISGLSPDDVQKKKAEDYPAIAALGYIISGLDEPYIDVASDRELHDQLMQGRMVEGL